MAKRGKYVNNCEQYWLIKKLQFNVDAKCAVTKYEQDGKIRVKRWSHKYLFYTMTSNDVFMITYHALR